MLNFHSYIQLKCQNFTKVGLQRCKKQPVHSSYVSLVKETDGAIIMKQSPGLPADQNREEWY
jgi:hypothetical protein